MFEKISIHALREEGDLVCSSNGAASCNFYPRPPRGGRHSRYVFLVPRKSISIHALREEGDYILIEVDGESLIISIHALREEGDQEER